jgi:hypothetical protein
MLLGAPRLHDGMLTLGRICKCSVKGGCPPPHRFLLICTSAEPDVSQPAKSVAAAVGDEKDVVACSTSPAVACRSNRLVAMTTTEAMGEPGNAQALTTFVPMAGRSR